MKLSSSLLTSQRGYLVLVAVIMIMIVGLMGVVITQLFFGSAFSNTAHYQGDTALYLAEAGIEHATHELLQPTLSNRTTCADFTTALTNNFGAGSYSVNLTSPATTAAFVSSPTVLNETLTATTATINITVTSTAGYQSAGRIMLDSEMINYTSIDAIHFNGVTRGVDGSSVTGHDIGTPIGQYQCNLTSVAGVPNLTTPQGKRTLRDTVQLQEAWAVGNVATSNYRIIHWNRPTELAWNDASISGSASLQSVSMISYVDGWAVGDAQGANLLFLKWDGSSWTRILPTVTLSTDLNSVYCITHNDCWAVGDSIGSPAPVNLLFEHWNGTNWTRVLPASTLSSNLNSVHCVDANNCWAVGDSVGSPPPTNLLFERWDGANWTRILPASSLNARLNGVFCNSTSDCWAVGNAVGSPNPATLLFERWNGTNWSRVFATTTINANLNNIFCNSASDCWAVGDANGSQDLIMHWNGTNWQRDTSPPTTGAQNLKGISCSNENDCWAVGLGGHVIHWDGTSWAYGASGTTTQLNSVSMLGAYQLPLAGWQEVFS